MVSEICYLGAIGHYNFLYKTDKCVSSVLESDEKLVATKPIFSYLKVKYEKDFVPMLLEYKKPQCIKSKYVLAWIPKGYIQND